MKTLTKSNDEDDYVEDNDPLVVPFVCAILGVAGILMTLILESSVAMSGILFSSLLTASVIIILVGVATIWPRG